MKKHLILAVILLFVLSGCAGSQKTGENPVGGVVDDSTITTRINHEMLKDDIVKSRQIDVDTIGGHVILTGVVATPEESARAVQIDNVISNKIKAKLIAEPEVRSLNIDVDVYLGVVTLSGIVSTNYQKDRAIHISRNTDGTIKVIDNLKVR
jgi:osmotically-inducible protein OsmY